MGMEQTVQCLLPKRASQEKWSICDLPIQGAILVKENDLTKGEGNQVSGKDPKSDRISGGKKEERTDPQGKQG